jgi:hypothetical protein
VIRAGIPLTHAKSASCRQVQDDERYTAQQIVSGSRSASTTGSSCTSSRLARNQSRVTQNSRIGQSRPSNAGR